MLNKLIPRGKKNYKIVLRHKISIFYRSLPSFLLLVILITLGVWGYSSFHSLEFSIDIDSNKVSELQVREVMVAGDISATREEILALPWVHSLKIQRRWNKVALTITTNQVVYNYAQEGKIVGFINQEGQLFKPALLKAHDVTTIVCDAKDILQSFQRLKTYQSIIPSLDIKTFSSGDIEVLTLKNGTQIILGMQQQEQRLRRMAQYLPIFKFRRNSVVDLRYKNGFAKLN